MFWVSPDDETNLRKLLRASWVGTLTFCYVVEGWYLYQPGVGCNSNRLLTT